jgi:GMP synthase (glutamine-hydrolysing)
MSFGFDDELPPRLKTSFWVEAHIRRCWRNDIPALVVRRGHDAGAVLVKVNAFENGCVVLAAAVRPSGRVWIRATGADPVSDEDAEAYIARQLGFDPDLWVIEIEDRQGRSLLEEPIL